MLNLSSESWSEPSLLKTVFVSPFPLESEFVVPANRREEVDLALKDVDFSKKVYQVQFETTLGNILVDLYPDLAPGHCKNIIGLTKIGFYDGIIFHRVIPGFMAQVGCPQGTGTGGPGYKIRAEFNNTLHEAGILSMARTSDPHSAGSQIFLCLARAPHLDGQYTVFGKTADQASLDVLLKIGQVETNSSDRPLKEVKIIKGTVIEKAK